MADKVNEQVTDALTQNNVSVVAVSPAQALGTLYQMFSQAVGISAQNMTQQQAALNQISNAVVSKAVAMILSVEASPKGGSGGLTGGASSGGAGGGSGGGSAGASHVTTSGPQMESTH
ncbi:RebB like protein [Burkholderia gladioli]|uniref:RebB family R body protein n=1 Tax=Burkholderia TaxID=32008 RepID=UPI000467FC31|nr:MULTISPECIES: RebB family R body protein [Burkholderia]AYQ88767.1 RebB like protein [Burkholderia gladioli]KVM65194.1 RebB like protein [Burkholderia gladioli]NIF69041.1 RebB like protein [Burkholderia sp. Ap-962]